MRERRSSAPRTALNTLSITIPDGGDFASGSLCWNVLSAAAQHMDQLPDVVDLSSCVHLKPYSVACLAAIAAKAGRASVELMLPTDDGCRDHLARLGLFQWFQCDGCPPDCPPHGTNVPVEQLCDGPGDFSDNATRVWEQQLGGLPAGVRHDLADHLDEVILNALQHAESPIHCIVAGQAFPTTRKVEVAVVDLGQTIRGHLTRARQYSSLQTDEEAILKATEEAVTGALTGDHSGAGLTALRQFFEGGGGHLTILSGSAYLVFRPGQPPLVRGLWGGFAGTLVNLHFDTIF